MEHMRINTPQATWTIVETTIKNWPRRSRKTAQVLIVKYGLPHEITDTMIIWYHNGPWKRTVVYRDGVAHNFPRPHLDVLGQTVEYKVPLNVVGELAEFDGSIVVDRTRGDITVHCNSEEMNMLMLNLAHDIVIGNRTVEEARNACIKATMSLRIRWPEPYTTGLQFSTRVHEGNRESDTPDPDRAVTQAV